MLKEIFQNRKYRFSFIVRFLLNPLWFISVTGCIIYIFKYYNNGLRENFLLYIIQFIAFSFRNFAKIYRKYISKDPLTIVLVFFGIILIDFLMARDSLKKKIVKDKCKEDPVFAEKIKAEKEERRKEQEKSATERREKEKQEREKKENWQIGSVKSEGSSSPKIYDTNGHFKTFMICRTSKEEVISWTGESVTTKDSNGTMRLYNKKGSCIRIL